MASDEQQHPDVEGVVTAVGLLASIVEGAGDAIVSLDVHGTIIGWNPAAERLFGYAKGEVLGHRIAMLVPEQLRERDWSVVAQVLEGRQVRHYETQRLHKDGHLLDVSLTVSALTDVAGGIIGAAKIVRDITRERQARTARAELAAIVENSDDAIISMDTNGLIRNWNPAATRLFGYTPDEVVGHHVGLLLPDALRSRDRETLDVVLAGGKVDHYETRRVHKDGTVVDVSLTVSPLRDDEGRIVGASKIVRDVTESKAMQRRLDEAHRHEAELAAIVEGTDDAILSKTAEGTIVSWNRGCEQLYGYTAAEAIGRPATMLFPLDRQGEERVLLRHVLANEPVEHYETQRMRKDGSIVDVSLTVSPLHDRSGTIVGASSIARDISVQKLLERQLRHANEELAQLDELKSQFLAMASHELRTPLTAIAGFSSTMVDMWESLPDERKRDFVEIIDRQASRLTRLVDDLLVLSKIESGKLHSAPAVVDVGATIERTVRELVATNVAVRCDGQLCATADENHLQQILLNYVSNALKYGREPITVVACSDQEGRGVLIKVCDHGEGVPPEFEKRLFERFSRAPQHGSLPGTGLGLSIVRGLARAQGGDAWYEPNEPQGARFCVRVPAAGVESGAGIGASQPQPVG